MSGTGDIFRPSRPSFDTKDSDREDDPPLGYSEHVRGRVERPGPVRLRPAQARRQTEPVKCSRGMRVRAALGSKEVAFKVVSYGRDLDSVKRQLRYIARDGEVPLERAHGEIVEGGRDAVDAVAEEWSGAFSERKGGARNSIHVLVSTPAGSDRDSVEDAAREFAARTFGGNWDYVMARHDDTANPHVHIVAEARGMDGQRFTVDPPDIQPMRERFAEACREEGLDLTATPRAVRAVTDRSEPIGLVKLREDGAVPERDVRSQAGADAQRERSAEERLIAHEAKINRALATELRETGDVEDARAADGLDDLAARADAVLDPDTAARGDATEHAPVEPDGKDAAREAELSGLDHLAALEQLVALRKRKYDDLRARFVGMSGRSKSDALDSMREYEREMNAAHAEIGALRETLQPPEQAVDPEPLDVRSERQREERGADREDDRDDDRDDDR